MAREPSLSWINNMLYSKRQINLPFTIKPPGDAHGLCKEDSAFTRSKNRRRKRHKEKIYDVSYIWTAMSNNKKMAFLALCRVICNCAW